MSEEIEIHQDDQPSIRQLKQAKVFVRDEDALVQFGIHVAVNLDGSLRVVDYAIATGDQCKSCKAIQ